MTKKQRVATVYSSYADGINGVTTEIEVSISPGIPTYDVIGLCDSSIKESRGRIVSALSASGFKFPGGHIIISISPAYMHKSGSSFDLPIAIGILLASGQISIQVGKQIYAEGELSLDGMINPTPGAMTRLFSVKSKEYHMCLFPQGTVGAARALGFYGMPVTHLREITGIFGSSGYQPQSFSFDDYNEEEFEIDFGILKGQEKAKRALTIAASGRHSIILLGSPGCGKTTAGMLVKSILPKMNRSELQEVLRIQDLSDNVVVSEDKVSRPFRVIHPGTSISQLNGSSRTLQPGEIAMANHGVLMADEICEYKSSIIDNLRIPLENHEIVLSKDGNSYAFPASFVFVGSGNPCRCGMLYEPGSKCKCTRAMRERYLSKLSGPFLDRIDIFAEMRSINSESMRQIMNKPGKRESIVIRQMVSEAWDIQRERYKNVGANVFNGTYTGADIADLIRAPERVIDEAVTLSARYGYSARGFSRILRVGRTIADLDKRIDMNVNDIYEAAVFRNTIKEA